MKKISLKGASWDSVFLAVGKVLTLLFGILSAKLLSTGLSLSEYGTYSQANLVSTVGRSLILLGLGDALNYYFNKKSDDIDEKLRYRIVNTVFFLELFVGAVLAVCIVFGQDLIAIYFSNSAVKVLLPIVSVIPILTNLIYFYQILYVAVGKAKIMSAYTLATTIIKIITIYLAVYVLKNLVWIYVVMVLQDIIVLMIFHLSLSKKDVRIQPWKISKAHIRPIFAYSLPMGVFVITNEFTRDLDKLIIGRLADTESLAIYTNCSKILPFDFFVTSFAMVLIPYIVKYVTENKKELSVDLFSSYLKIGYYSVWVLGVAVLIAPETMISFLYSEEYVVGKDIYIMYIFDSMLRFASMHLILTAANKSKNLMAYSIFSLILNFVLNIVFYYIFGITGPAIATLVVAVVYTWLILHKTIKVLDTSWIKVFNLKEIGILIASLAIFWAVGSLLNNLLIQAGVHEYLSMIISMAVYGLSLLAIHFKKIFGVLKKINEFRM